MGAVTDCIIVQERGENDGSWDTIKTFYPTLEGDEEECIGWAREFVIGWEFVAENGRPGYALRIVRRVVTEEVIKTGPDLRAEGRSAT